VVGCVVRRVPHFVVRGESAVVSAALKRWYGFLHEQECVRCGARPTVTNPVEAAHWRLVVSAKTGDLLPRSHQGQAAWGCLPLCRACHLEQHEVGERAFSEEIRPGPAERWGTLLLRFFSGDTVPF
jgi:hypothetical protein